MKEFTKSKAYPVVFMVIISLILTFLLAFINEETKDKVAMNDKLELQRKILYIFNIDLPSDDPENIPGAFNKNVKTKEYNGKELYIQFNDLGEEIAYAVPFEGPGLWGWIEGYVGIKSDLKETTGVEFIRQSETPGLGGRIGEEPYKSQYRGIDISNPIGEKRIISRPQAGGNIDAISGATQTSNFVEVMINEDLNTFIEDLEGGRL